MTEFNALHLPELFELGITQLVEELRPERVFLSYRSKDEDAVEFPRAYAAQGLSLANLYTAEDLSTEIVRQAIREGKSEVIMDAMASPNLTNRNSVILSGLRSVMVLPLKHESGLVVGLAYLDNRAKTAAFGDEELASAQAIVSKLESAAVEAEKRSLVDLSAKPSQDDLSTIRAKAFEAVREGSAREAMDLVEGWLRGRPSSGTEVGTAHGIRSHILESQGLEGAAFAAIAQAVHILGQAANSPCSTYAVMLNNLAGFHVKRENHQRALGLFSTAAEQWQGLGRKDMAFVKGLAGTSYNLGTLFLKLGKATQARSWLANALDLSTEAYGADHPKIAKIKESIYSV